MVNVLVSTVFGDSYRDWLPVVHPETNSNGDLVAHFFRRAFSLLRKSGCFGLIATNTIAQGDTRSTGLRYICEQGGTIYNAQKRMKWPGLAAVVVSVIHVFKGKYESIKLLDGREVNLISAFLFHAGGNENPAVLLANASKSFQGSIVLGMGFTFDDSNPDATPIVEMQRLIAENPKNQERIFPYIGGSEVNSSPTHTHHRYVINFGDMSEDEARQFPDLMKILEEKVKPERDKIIARGKQIHEYDYWKFWDKRLETYEAIAPLNSVLGISRVGQHGSFTFLPNKIVYSDSLVVIAIDSFSAFSTLQSRPHEIWARFLGSSMKDDLRYTPSDCFETFPFPENWETNPTLEAAGKTYYEYRAALMVRNNQGLTDTYNRFHDPDERHPDILQLRLLHAQMDQAVLDAYGWTDISTDCTFLLDYEDEEEDENTSKRQKKKPWRYRWPEEIHDEVLARLLELNQQRAEAETLSGKAAEKGKVKGNTKKAGKTRKATETNLTIPGFPSASV
ncbi:MAG: type IIL restriction-modification enzyme MmeI [Nostoc sp.]